jgi:glycosyltransferase involved in cell wall biosynthesis
VPRVTVVIPAWNAARFLPDALASVRAQTWRDFETVVVDDGSTDASGELVERDFPEVRLLRRERGGPAAARNLAVARGSGEIIALLDADDAWHPQKLALQIERLDASPDAVLVACLAEDWDGRPIGVDVLPEGHLTSRLVAGNFLVNSSVLVRRQVFDLCGGLDEDPALVGVEDYALWLEASLFGPLAAVNRRLVRLRRYEGSLSSDPLLQWRRVDHALAKLAQSPEVAGWARKIGQSRAQLQLVIARAELGRGCREQARAALQTRRALDPATVWSHLAWQAVAALPAPVLRVVSRLRARIRMRAG